MAAATPRTPDHRASANQSIQLTNTSIAKGSQLNVVSQRVKKSSAQLCPTATGAPYVSSADGMKVDAMVTRPAVITAPTSAAAYNPRSPCPRPHLSTCVLALFLAKHTAAG